MTLWNIRAPFYKWFRAIYPFNLVLQKETENIKELLYNIDINSGIGIDIGCGIGNSLQLVGQNLNMVGLDSSFKMAQKSRAFNHNIILGRAEYLPLKNQSVNVILIVGVLEYIEDVNQFFKELSRVGTDKSYVLITSSPPNVYTMLRSLTGIKLRPRNPEDINNMASTFNFTVIDWKKQFSQHAFLLQKNKSMK